jgi:hypothetical protein
MTSRCLWRRVNGAGGLAGSVWGGCGRTGATPIIGLIRVVWQKDKWAAACGAEH